MTITSIRYFFLISFVTLIFDIMIFGSGRMWPLSFDLGFYNLSYRHLIFLLVCFTSLFLFSEIYRFRIIFFNNFLFFSFVLFYSILSLFFLKRDLTFILNDVGFIFFLIFPTWFLYLRLRFSIDLIKLFKFIIILIIFLNFILLIIQFNNPFYIDYLLRIYTNYEYFDFVIHKYSIFTNAFIFYLLGFWIFYFEFKNFRLFNFLILFLLVILIMITFQRALIISLLFSFIFLVILKLKNNQINPNNINLRDMLILIFLILATIFVFMLPKLKFNQEYINQYEITNEITNDSKIIQHMSDFRTYSSLENDVRIQIIKDYIGDVNLRSFIFGNGFGTGFSFRKLHFEFFGMEILYKGGIIGVCFFIFFLYPIFKFIKLIYNNFDDNIKIESVILFFSTLSFLILSFFNPFFLNAFGILIYSAFLSYEK